MSTSMGCQRSADAALPMSPAMSQSWFNFVWLAEGHAAANDDIGQEQQLPTTDRESYLRPFGMLSPIPSTQPPLQTNPSLPRSASSADRRSEHMLASTIPSLHGALRPVFSMRDPGGCLCELAPETPNSTVVHNQSKLRNKLFFKNQRKQGARRHQNCAMPHAFARADPRPLQPGRGRSHRCPR